MRPSLLHATALLLALSPLPLLAQADTTARVDSTHADTAARAAAPAPQSPTQVVILQRSEDQPVFRNGRRVVRVGQDGTLVTLQDGTRWEIYLPDRPTTDAWRAGDFVILRDNPAPVDGFNALLVHSADERFRAPPVRARFAGRERIGS